MVTKTEIYLLISRGFRMLGNLEESIIYCELGIETLPPSERSLILLADLQRLRVLLFLDENKFNEALNLLEEIDGIEVNLGNSKLVTRKDEDIQPETYLVGLEIFLSLRQFDKSQFFFIELVEKITQFESQVFKMSPLRAKAKRIEIQELKQKADVFGAILQIHFGDESGYEKLESLLAQVRNQNSKSFNKQNKILPNRMLESQILCLLGLFSGSELDVPIGINFFEAVRWSNFTKTIGENTNFAIPVIDEGKAPDFDTVPASPVFLFPKNDVIDSFAVEKRATEALEKIAGSFLRLEAVAPILQGLVLDKNAQDSNQISSLFGGHLLYFDLDAMLFNASQGDLTGYIQFTWQPDYYQSQVVLGLLPQEISFGEAFLFFDKGIVIDATVGNAKIQSDSTEAMRNFKLITKLCYSIGLDVPVKVQGNAIQALSDAQNRPKLLKITQDDMLAILTEIENDVSTL